MDMTNKSRKRKQPLDFGTMLYGKVPPQARELEDAVLGACMIEKTAFDIISEIRTRYL